MYWDDVCVWRYGVWRSIMIELIVCSKESLSMTLKVP